MANKTNPKIWTIIKHEYLIRLRSKGFIIGTIAGPLGLLLFIGIVAFVTYISKYDTSRKIAICDKSGVVGKEIVRRDTSKYFYSTKSEEKLQEELLAGKIDAYLFIPESILDSGKANVYSGGGGGLGFVQGLNRDLESVVRLKRLQREGVDDRIISLFYKEVEVETNKLTKEGAEKDYAEIYSIIGYVFGLAIYMMMFIYGAMVMRGVIEEKANRIVEVIASSAKPFEIMFGKVVGIGAVGLTQVLFWVLIGSLLLMSGESIYVLIMGPPELSAGMNPEAAAAASDFEIPYISPWIAVGFVFYFLAGYFIYASLFAAVGSAVDQESDAQQLQAPVTIPIVIPMLFLPYIMSNPDSLLATILSLIPFFTPIIMTIRVVSTPVPIWQIALSVVLLFASFYGTLWVAARIYRVGILMYGKKPKFKDLLKWIKLSN